MIRALVGLIGVLYIPISIWGQPDLLLRHDEGRQELSSQQSGVAERQLGITSLVGIRVSHRLNNGPDSAFDWIKSLAGEWEGSFEWSGVRTDKGQMNARYYLTGNGSAVVEDLINAGKPVMTSVYHLDGSDLRMTHYCGAGNQPRLKANAIDEGKKTIRFELVDVTNLKSPSAGHVQGVELRFRDENHLTLIFTFRGAGKESYEQVELTRLRRS